MTLDRQPHHYAKQPPGSHAAGISRSSRQRIAIGRSPSWWIYRCPVMEAAVVVL